MPEFTYRDIAKMIDHSLLKQTMTDAELEQGCQVAREFGVASVCIKPYAVRHAAICRAMPVWPLLGCPLSPMTANFSEPALFGSRSSCPLAGRGSPINNRTKIAARYIVVPPRSRSR